KNGKIRIELNFLRRDGTRFPVDLSSTIIRTKDEETLSLIIIRDISIWKEAEEALKREKELLENISVFDYLTKILNRRGLMKRIEEEIVRCNRSGTALTLAMVDMDFLKKINDAYGHRCGDEVLCRVVEVFKENIRPYDILGRFAGDEFIFCFPATGLAEGIIIAERLRKSLENAEIEYEGSKITVTASFGLTEYQPDSNMNVDNLFSKADDQMYLAKRRRNFVCFPQN
ncbi:MAG: sensor domain-containing diguanylate cyclase, partial [Synergistaceae bacterium]|nr:sensor domain-containing diguanylate cyclase [Synergistaceae bacterium]